MDARKFIVGSVVGGIVYFVLGWLVFGVLLDSVMEGMRTPQAASIERMQPLMWAVGVACLLTGVLITYALGSRGGAAAGAKVGAIVGLLLWGASDFMFYGFTTLSTLSGTIVDPLVSAVVSGIAGAVLGLVVGKMKSA